MSEMCTFGQSQVLKCCVFWKFPMGLSSSSQSSLLKMKGMCTWDQMVILGLLIIWPDGINYFLSLFSVLLRPWSNPRLFDFFWSKQEWRLKEGSDLSSASFLTNDCTKYKHISHWTFKFNCTNHSIRIWALNIKSNL